MKNVISLNSINWSSCSRTGHHRQMSFLGIILLYIIIYYYILLCIIPYIFHIDFKLIVLALNQFVVRFHWKYFCILIIFVLIFSEIQFYCIFQEYFVEVSKQSTRSLVDWSNVTWRDVRLANYLICIPNVYQLNWNFHLLKFKMRESATFPTFRLIKTSSLKAC